MPGKKAVEVKGEREAIKKLQNIKKNALRNRTIVSAAKSSGDSTLRDMQAGISQAISNGNELANLLGKKKIPKSYGGEEWPGAWIGIKKKSEYTVPASGGAVSIYWVEFGTDERHNDRSGRYVGRMKEKAPLRNAIKSNSSGARSSFSNELIRAINRRVKRNSI